MKPRGFVRSILFALLVGELKINFKGPGRGHLPYYFPIITVAEPVFIGAASALPR